MEESLIVALGERSYPIHIGAGIMGDIVRGLPFSLKDRSVFILTDANVEQPHGQLLLAKLKPLARSVDLLAMPPGEATKSFASLERVLSWLLERGADRRSVLFALGGGVIGDLGGLAAALALRGIPFVQMPTTLLAQVDSSVGGKTAINTNHGKNLVGAFYQPAAVFCDLDTLKTLPRREILAGYAEIAKCALLGDAVFFDWLEKEGKNVCALASVSLEQAVKRACKAKADIVAEDETEQGRRALLNLGHTFGHALEKIGGFDGRVLHGEAVAVGIVLAFRLSALRGDCPPEAAERAAAHLHAIGLPTRIKDILPTIAGGSDDIIAAMERDKKAESGRLVFILARDIGQAFIARDVDLTQVEAVIKQSMQD